MAIQSGHGATLAFGTTTTFSPGYTTIGGFEISRDSLDTSTLATAGARLKIGGDLYDVGPQTHSYLIDPTLFLATEAGAIDDLLFDGGAVSVAESITITLAIGGSFAGTGHVTGFALEDLGTDQLIAATISTQWNDWPTVTQQT